MKRLFVILISITMIWAVMSCSDSKLIHPEPPMIEVSGTVSAIPCVWFDPAILYHEVYHLPATVLFTNLDNDIVYETTTDEESTYDIELSKGTYLVESFSYHWRPFGYDTIMLEQDTVVDQAGLIAWEKPDTMYIYFYYPSGDTLSIVAEQNFLDILNMASGEYLDVENYRHEYFGTAYPGDIMAIQYYLPILNDVLPWVVEDSLEYVLETDTLTFPDKMYAHLLHISCIQTVDEPEF